MECISSKILIIFFNRSNADNFKFSSDDQEIFFTTPEDDFLVHFAKLADSEPVLYDNVIPMSSLQSGRNSVVIPSDGPIYYMDNVSDKDCVKNIVADGASCVYYNPDGSVISYVSNDNIFLYNISTGEINQLTTDGGNGISNMKGTADYIIKEEFDRYVGYWWDNTGKYIVYCQNNIKHIPSYVFNNLLDEDQTSHIDNHFCFAGKPNAIEKLAVINVETKETIWLDQIEHYFNDYYIVQVKWFCDNSIGIAILNREQNKLHLIRYDLASKKYDIIMTDEDAQYLDVKYLLFESCQLEGDDIKNNSFHIICSSQRNDFNHLYLYHWNGKESRFVNQITFGNGEVFDILHIDPDRELIFYSAFLDSPLEKHIYVSPLKPLHSDEIPLPHRLTVSNTSNNLVISHNGLRGVLTTESFESPLAYYLVNIKYAERYQDTEIIKYYELGSDPEAKDYIKPQVITFKSSTGEILYGLFFKGQDNDNSYDNPTLIYVYGGPSSRLVSNRYYGRGMGQSFGSRGYNVWLCDNRGSELRGKKFDHYLYHAFGTVEVEDQIKGIEVLTEMKMINPERIGVYGWSYGGYMSLLLSSKYPKMKCCIAGGAVSDWCDYDTGYTERYLGKPQEYPEVYKNSGLLHNLKDIKCPILLIHGYQDDNVVFRHFGKIVQELYNCGIIPDVMIFPSEKHGVASNGKALYMKMDDFLNSKLKN